MKIKTQKNLKIPCPTKAEVKKYLKKWENDYDLKETAERLAVLFTETYPRNNIYHEVWIKVNVLNSAFNVNVPEIYKVAKHISKQKSIEVETIRRGHGACKKGAKNESDLYSFATKFYSFHNQGRYPLFDSNVRTALIYFRDISCSKNFTFSNADLMKYEEFVGIIKNFQKVFGLQESLRDIDKYLYLVGKEIKKEKENIRKKKHSD